MVKCDRYIVFKAGHYDRIAKGELAMHRSEHTSPRPHRLHLRALAAVCILICAAFSRQRCDAGGYWERFPKAPGRIDGDVSIGFDESGGLWAASGSYVYMWDGEQFHRTEDPELRASLVSGLCGGPDRGLYTTQSDGSPFQEGNVYLLEDGNATRVTNFQDSHIYSPSVYVSKDGRLFNLPSDQIRVFDGQVWHEAPFDGMWGIFGILDAGTMVHVCSRGAIYSIDESCSFQTISRPVSYSFQIERAALWGTNKAIFIDPLLHTIEATNLDTGDLIPLDDTIMSFEAYSPIDASSAPDGSVWILGHDGQILRVKPDGNTELISEMVGLPWYRFNANYRYMEPILFDGDDSVWFGIPGAGVFHYTDGCVTHFDYLQGQGPSTCKQLVKGPDGNIYAASDWWLYAYHQDSPVDEAPHEDWPRIETSLDCLWSRPVPIEDRNGRCSKIGDSYVWTRSSGRDNPQITVIDLLTGMDRFSIRPLAVPTWVVSGSTLETFVVADANDITTFDAYDGHMVNELTFDCDSRIEPLFVGTDCIVIRGLRGNTIKRMDSTGNEIWSADLPGYAASQPKATDSVLIVQTCDRYGTVALDLATGEQLWFDTPFVGHGLCKTLDDQYVIEAAGSGSPYLFEGQLVGRDPISGEKLWQYSLATNALAQSPLCGPNNHVYALFQGGEIVCLDVTTGETAWQVLLPDRVFTNSRGGYQDAYVPRWPYMTLEGDWLTAVDRNGLIYIIEADTGQVRARLDPTGKFLDNGIRTGSAGFIGMPCIVGDTLIVPTQETIAAYSLLGVLDSVEPLVLP